MADLQRYHVTTRNVFAIIYKASLVGTSLYETLCDLHKRLDEWMPPDLDNAGTIIDYLGQRGMDDVRNDPASAASLLAWSEGPTVRWQEGFRESYIHCAGMYKQVRSRSDYKHVSSITKHLLEISNLESEDRIQSVQDRLAAFDFAEMFSSTSSQLLPARESFDSLRKFLVQYYKEVYGTWPVEVPNGEDQWLTRTLVNNLQQDFAALYNYLVDRDVHWDCSEERSGRKWKMITTSGKTTTPDTPDLPLTDMLIAFDTRHKYPHIPHPYPLVPESVPVQPTTGLFGMTPKKSKSAADERILERKVTLAYTEATNIYLLGSDFVANDFVDAFVQFEKTNKPAEVDPFTARRGRWALIYGILQTLATVSVDTPMVHHKKNVPYYLNPRLRSIPPWKGADKAVEEASHNLSYCWTVIRTWDSNYSDDVSSPLNFVRRPRTDRLERNHDSTIPSLRNSLFSDSDLSSPSLRSPSLMSPSFHSPRFMNDRHQMGNRNRWTRESDNTSYSGVSYEPSITRIGRLEEQQDEEVDWNMRESSSSRERVAKSFLRSGGGGRASRASRVSDYSATSANEQALAVGSDREASRSRSRLSDVGAKDASRRPSRSPAPVEKKKPLVIVDYDDFDNFDF